MAAGSILWSRTSAFLQPPSGRTEQAISSASFSSAARCSSLTEERMVTPPSRKVMFLSLPSRSRIRPPAVGAQEPFSIRATVRFCRLWATMSCRAVSMLMKMPAL